MGVHRSSEKSSRRRHRTKRRLVSSCSDSDVSSRSSPISKGIRTESQPCKSSTEADPCTSKRTLLQLNVTPSNFWSLVETCDQEEELKPLSKFIDDRRALTLQMFAAIGRKDLRKMLPNHLKRYRSVELHSLFTKELGKLHRESILAILEGKAEGEFCQGRSVETVAANSLMPVLVARPEVAVADSTTEMDDLGSLMRKNDHRHTGICDYDVATASDARNFFCEDTLSQSTNQSTPTVSATSESKIEIKSECAEVEEGELLSDTDSGVARESHIFEKKDERSCFAGIKMEWKISRTKNKIPVDLAVTLNRKHVKFSEEKPRNDPEESDNIKTLHQNVRLSSDRHKEIDIRRQSDVEIEFRERAIRAMRDRGHRNS